MAMAVLLVGKQCCVSNSAMERYDPPFCRNSTMTSFAGTKSWNFCGRRGVNSATALRTSAGSNVFIGRNDLDKNREIGRNPCGHDNSGTRISLCRSTVADKLRPRPVRGRRLFEAADCLRTVHVRCPCLFTDDGGRCLCAATDCSRMRLAAWIERDHGLIVDMANTRLRPVLNRFAFVEMPRLWP